ERNVTTVECRICGIAIAAEDLIIRHGGIAGGILREVVFDDGRVAAIRLKVDFFATLLPAYALWCVDRFVIAFTLPIRIIVLIGRLALLALLCATLIIASAAASTGGERRAGHRVGRLLTTFLLPLAG